MIDKCKILIITLIAGIFVITAAALPRAANATQINDRPVHLYVGINMAYANYSEPTIGVSHKSTYFPGMVAKIAIEQPAEFAFFSQIQYKYQSGSYDYDGYIQYLDGSKRSYHDTALPNSKQGGEFIIGSYVGDVLKLFVGMEYENIVDDGFTASPYFYQRTRDSFYGILGAGAYADFGFHKSLEIMVAAKPMMRSYHDSRLSDLGGIWADVPTMHQKQPHGLRFDISAKYRYENLWFQPYFQYTSIGGTKYDKFCLSNGLCGRISEPENQTTEIGINMGVWF